MNDNNQMTDKLAAVRRIMAEQKDWSISNFGPVTADNVNDPLLGIIEELGELSRAVLKKKQGIRGTAKEHDAAAFDAVGDMLIFTIDAANRTGTPIDWARSLAHAGYLREWRFTACAVAVATNCSAMEYDCPGYVREFAVNSILAATFRLAELLGIDPTDAVIRTWDEVVAKRDWKARPDCGIVPQEIMGLPDLVDNSEILIKAHEDGVVKLCGEHLNKLYRIRDGEITGKLVPYICREITQNHYGELLEGGLV